MSIRPILWVPHQSMGIEREKEPTGRERHRERKRQRIHKRDNQSLSFSLHSFSSTRVLKSISTFESYVGQWHIIDNINKATEEFICQKPTIWFLVYWRITFYVNGYFGASLCKLLSWKCVSNFMESIISKTSFNSANSIRNHSFIFKSCN